MRIIKRGEYTPKKEITCSECGSILEITHHDLRKIDEWSLDSCVICPVCEKRIRISKEIRAYLCK